MLGCRNKRTWLLLFSCSAGCTVPALHYICISHMIQVSRWFTWSDLRVCDYSRRPHKHTPIHPLLGYRHMMYACPCLEIRATGMLVYAYMSTCVRSAHVCTRICTPLSAQTRLRPYVSTHADYPCIEILEAVL